MSWLGSTNKSNMGPPDIGDVEESDSDDDSMSGRLKVMLGLYGIIFWRVCVCLCSVHVNRCGAIIPTVKVKSAIGP